MSAVSNQSLGDNRGGQYSSRLVSPRDLDGPNSPGGDTLDLNHSASGPLLSGQPPGVLRKKLYDQNLSDWSARYRKNKQSLDNLAKDCEFLRSDVARQQQEVDERVDQVTKLEDRFVNEVQVKFNNVKAGYEDASMEKGNLQVELSKERADKNKYTREKKLLRADYDRKHAELLRMAETRDQLEAQLSTLTQQLGQMSYERKRMERELDMVQHNLRANTELADEVHHEIAHVHHGITDSIGHHMANNRNENSVGSPGRMSGESRYASSPERYGDATSQGISGSGYYAR